MFTKRAVLAIGIAAAMLLSLPVAKPVWAGDGTAKNAADSTKPDNTKPDDMKNIEKKASVAADNESAKKITESAEELELHQLRDELSAQMATLQAQQQRIAALEAALHMSSGNEKPPATGSAPDPETVRALAAGQQELNQKVLAMQNQMATTAQSFEERLKNFGPFSFSGDLRLRDEPFFGGPADQSQVRDRMRFRIRFNADAKLNEDISGGFSLASGDLNNPISTNQTANQFYTRKPFDLDRAFVSYNPGFFKALTLTGGKFWYPWYNTELTWDKDLNPEGVSEQLAWNFENLPGLKHLAFIGFQLPFAETAGVNFIIPPGGNKSTIQSVVYGGQIQTVWQLTDWLKFGAYTAFYNWHNADPVALAVATANTASPEFGLLKLQSNSDQNSTVTTTETFTATGQKVITNSQFASKFGLFDNIARFDVKMPSERWPLIFLGDYVQNTKACANVGNILPAPANTAAATFTQSTNAPCNSHERRAYWLEGGVGSQKKKGDWFFSYTRMFIDREAVLGVFNYSEMRQGSNVSQHRVQVFYEALQNVELDFIGLFGRPLVTASSPGPAENLLKRLQFDVTYKF